MNLPTSAIVSTDSTKSMSTIFAAGLLCGVLDITAAFITWVPQGVPARVILQGIASGLLGMPAFRGGFATAALGLGLHFFIAITAAAVFYAVSRKLPWLVRHPYMAGVLYGVAVYIVMYWIVLPLSRFHRALFSLAHTIVAVLTHIVCVGLPIALVVHYRSVDRAPGVSS
jgi:hypothetical protein